MSQINDSTSNAAVGLMKELAHLVVPAVSPSLHASHTQPPHDTQNKQHSNHPFLAPPLLPRLLKKNQTRKATHRVKKLVKT